MQSEYLKKIKEEEKDRKMTKIFFPIFMLVACGFGIWIAVLATN